MKRNAFSWIAGSLLCAALTTSATTRYVNLNNPAPASPYTNWVTAATNIQDAVDVAFDADEIVVTDGIYATGGRAVYGTMTNRVAIDKAVTVRSANGPLVTVIEGAAVAGTTNGNGAIRCVYVGANAVLSGFTLTNGHTRGAGDWDKEQSGGGAWCEPSGVVSNCTLSGNSAFADGGGAYSGTLNNCTLSGNSAEYGGGAADGTLNNCTLSGNSASYDGGGAVGGTLNNCTLSGNLAEYGGGVFAGTLNNCIVYYNSARNGPNYYGGTFNYSCTTPLPPGPGNMDAEPRLASTSHLSAQSPCIGAGSSAYSRGVDIDGESWLEPPCMGADQFVGGQSTGGLTMAITAAYTNVSAGFGVAFVGGNSGRVSASAWDFGDGVVVSNRPYASHAWAAPGLYEVRLTGYNDSYPDGVSTSVWVRVGAREVYYVNGANAAPVYPYTNWVSAATNIQEAIDAGEQIGRLVLVADGVYGSGGRAAYGQMTNRVVVAEGVEVRSTNGPLLTVIEGGAVAGTTNGDGAIRCVYVGPNAVLSGFTLTNGHTRTDGDDDKEQSGGGAWCETSGVVSNCTLSGNSANSGGGAADGTLNNCTLSGNWADDSGGGAADGTLNNCTLSGNSASWGGGAYASTLNNCTLSGNSANYGGGAFSSTLNNCTLSGNSASHAGGGAYNGMLNNCIVYYNSAPGGRNHSHCTFNYSCTTPLPPGPGNMDAEPRLASASHLSAQSPCIGAGSSAYSRGVDIDGESWLAPPCMGADQYVGGQATGELTVGMTAAYTNVSTGFGVAFVTEINGRVSASAWDFGDGVVVSNRLYASHAWAAPGLYPVRLTGYNESYPGGVSASVWVRVGARETYYVNVANAAPVYPYTNWVGAATNIQEAIDAGEQIGRLVLVADGVYGSGGRAVYWQMTSRVVVAEGVEVRSVNGPLLTVIEGRAVAGTTNGDGAIRCVYVGTNAVLSGFTLTNGHTWTAGDLYKELSGGGAWCEWSGVVSNCTLSGNSAVVGGGAYGGTLNNCTLSGNSGGGAVSSTLNNCTLNGNSAEYGGGAYWGILNNCTLSGNSASSGGGAYSGALNNCTLSGNSASYAGGGAYLGTLNNCTLNGNSAEYGGGASGGTLNNCTLSGNSAVVGGGASGDTLNNCTLSGNSAEYGGGAYGGTLNNCIVYYNWAPDGPNYCECTFNYSCTTPLLPGPGNFTNAPLFVNTNGWSNLRLQANSRCINAGNNAYSPGGTDLDGVPRIAGGRVDIGGYEFQGAGLSGFTAWLWQHGLPIDGSSDYADSDTDGHDNWQEWQCQTDPTNALSALRLVSASPAGTNLIVTWQSVAGVSYYLLRSTNLSAQPPFALVATNLVGQAGATSHTDTNAARLAPVYYRVGVGDYAALAPAAPRLVWRFDAGAGTLEMSWAGMGFRLQAQTNHLGVGLATNWYDYPGGASSPVTVPADSAVGAVFYRLVWP